MRTALIVGVTGQDGSYLAEFLLEKGYKVCGVHRRSSVDGHFERIEHIRGKINLKYGNIQDGYSVDSVIEKVKPDEIYNLAAQSQVRKSFDAPFLTYSINSQGVYWLLKAIKKHVPNVKFYQASTSELFGEVEETPQSETTPFRPVSPYADSKLEAHDMVERAREKGLFGCCGILFNHESPRRGLEFVTRKFTDGIARIKLRLPQGNKKSYLEMGNLNAERDWGFAGDYVEAMWLMLQQEEPDDYVIATGENHTVREFIETAAKYVDIEITWKGEGLDEKGYDQEGNMIISINPEFFREREVLTLLGDYSKAREKLGWKPKTSFEELVEMMVKADLERLKKEHL